MMGVGSVTEGRMRSSDQHTCWRDADLRKGSVSCACTVALCMLVYFLHGAWRGDE